MDFRSHLSRAMDFRRWQNLAVAVITALTLVIAVVLWLGGRPGTVLFTPVYTFLVWALVREVDPDHDWTALAAAVFTAVWGLLGEPIVSGFAIAGLMVAARIVTSTTGRRPLTIDLVGVSVFGIAIGYGVAGWVAGFGIAVALYVDHRMRGDHRLATIAAAAVTAMGTTVVATAGEAFPDRLPDIVEWVTLAAGLGALLLAARDPAPPITQVDARHAAFIDKARLHASRSLIGCLVFLVTLLVGPEAKGATVLVVALGLVILSNEGELWRRRR